MPSTSEKQARFMAACSHGAGYDSCPPAKVSKDFNQADKGTPMMHKAMMARLKNKLALGGSPFNSTQLGPMNIPNMQRQTLPPPPSPGDPTSPIFHMGRPGVVGGGMPPPHGGVVGPSTATPLGPPGGGALGALAGGMGGMNRPPVGAAMPPPPANAPMPGGMGMSGPQMVQNNPGPVAPPMPTSGNTPMGMGGRQNMMQRARGGMINPPTEAMAGPKPGALSSLIGGGMAAQHAGFPGVKKPRVPMPGVLRNINQSINNAKTKLGNIQSRR